MALQDFVVQQNIMTHSRKRDTRESQVHQDPKDLVAHRVPPALLEFLENPVYQGLASEEPPDHQA